MYRGGTLACAQPLAAQKKHVQIRLGRRADSNRGPLHYELSASNPVFCDLPAKLGGRAESPSPWKFVEVHRAPAMCSNGVPIAAAALRQRIAGAEMRRSRKPFRAFGSDEGSNPSPSASPRNRMAMRFLDLSCSQLRRRSE